MLELLIEEHPFFLGCGLAECRGASIDPCHANCGNNIDDNHGHTHSSRFLRTSELKNYGREQLADEETATRTDSHSPLKRPDFAAPLQ